MSPATATRELSNALDGEVTLPGDPGYDDARSLYNAMIDKRPAVIARCAIRRRYRGRRRVRAHVRNLALAVRGGGHNGPGLRNRRRTVLVDRPLADERRRGGPGRAHRPRRRRRDTGATWTTRPMRSGWRRRPASSRRPASAGLTLGGGYGYLSRKYGLTIDNLLEADVVLADGELVTASERSTPTCSGRCAAAAATSASSPRSCSGSTRSARSIGGPMLWPMSSHRATSCAGTGTSCQAPDEDLNGFFASMTVPPAAPFPERAPPAQDVR